MVPPVVGVNQFDTCSSGNGVPGAVRWDSHVRWQMLVDKFPTLKPALSCLACHHADNAMPRLGLAINAALTWAGISSIIRTDVSVLESVQSKNTNSNVGDIVLLLGRDSAYPMEYQSPSATHFNIAFKFGADAKHTGWCHPNVTGAPVPCVKQLQLVLSCIWG